MNMAVTGCTQRGSVNSPCHGANPDHQSPLGQEAILWGTAWEQGNRPSPPPIRASCLPSEDLYVVHIPKELVHGLELGFRTGYAAEY